MRIRPRDVGVSLLALAVLWTTTPPPQLTHSGQPWWLRVFIWVAALVVGWLALLLVILAVYAVGGVARFTIDHGWWSW